jgi:hypothetical protein
LQVGQYLAVLGTSVLHLGHFMAHPSLKGIHPTTATASHQAFGLRCGDQVPGILPLRR